MADIFRFQEYFDRVPSSVLLMTFEEAAGHDIKCLRSEMNNVIEVLKGQQVYDKAMIKAANSIDERVETTNRRIDRLMNMLLDEIKELRNRLDALEQEDCMI
jgi:hypothetical protein